jgi:hypothetical protein
MATVEQTTMKVQRLLTGPMGLKISLEGEVFSVVFSDLSTSVQIRIHEWVKNKDGEPQTLVLISSLILKAVRPSPELFEWVARQGGSRWFGHVEVHEDKGNPGTVMLIFSHTLLGDYLDEAELGHGVFGILHGANEWDDELQKKFGGKRWVDA